MSTPGNQPPVPPSSKPIPGDPGGWTPGMPPAEHPEGTATLVVGVLSIVCGLLGPVAWAQGRSVLRDIDAHPGAYTNRQIVSVGHIIGIVMTCLLLAAMLVWVLIAIIAVSVSG